jgi:hypothetical protein
MSIDDRTDFDITSTGNFVIATWPESIVTLVAPQGKTLSSIDLDIGPISVVANEDEIIVSDFGFAYPGKATSISFWRFKREN